MDRGVRVNGGYLGDYSAHAQGESAVESSPLASADYGPCLYLGPTGQRCGRRALGGGFCDQHEPGAEPPASGRPSSRRTIATIAALAALLPWLTDLIRELIRLLR
jgi:hypothetical protein